MSRVRITLRRAGAVTALAAAGVLAAAGIASAHVTVHPDSYAKGATDGVLTFRVPNEEGTASTTKVQVFLPTDHPVLGVLVSPRDGWSAKVTNTKLKTPVKTDDGTISDAVSEVTWTGGKIDPGHYEDFDVAFGQLPEDTGHGPGGQLPGRARPAGPCWRPPLKAFSAHSTTHCPSTNKISS